MSIHKKATGLVLSEVANYAVSYLAGYSASMFVNHYFDTRKLTNLWGLTASRKVLSHDLYDSVMFWSTYLIGLMVGVLISQIIKRVFMTKSITEK